MGMLDRIAGWWSGSRAKSSRGERILMKLFPGYASSLPQTWSQNRAELVNHYRGWNYPPIRAICEEIAGTSPQVAYVRSPGEAAKTRAKALAIPDPHARRAALAHARAKYLPHHQRVKALAHVQAHADLEPVEHTHRLLRLLRKPNPVDVSWTFQYKIPLYMELTGLAYIWVVNNRMGLPAELWNLPSHWVRPVPGRETVFEAWEVRPSMGWVSGEWGGLGWFPGGSGVLRLEKDEVIQIAYPSPVHPWDGYSPVAAVGDWVDVSENIGRSRVAHFTNGAFPGVVLEIDKEVADPNDDQIRRIQGEWMNRYSGVLKNKTPVVLAPGIRMVPMTNTPVEMDYNASAEQAKNWLLAAHRVSPSNVGMAEETTFASMVASKAAYHESTIKPKLTLIGQVLSERLANRFADDSGELVIYWPDNTPADPDMKLRQYAGTPGPAVTPNEYRRDLCNLPEWDEDGDQPLAPMGISPIPLAYDEDEADLPLPALAAQKEQQQPALPAPGGTMGGEEEGPKGGLPTALGERLNGDGKHLNGVAH